MTRERIKECIKAYLLCTREIGIDYLPLDARPIQYALKLMGKAMAEKSIKKWIHKYYQDKKKDKVKERPQLTGNKLTDSVIKDRPIKPEEGLYPHEFLFLVLHAEDRLRKLKEFP